MGARKRYEWEGIKNTGDRAVPLIHHVQWLDLGGKEERLGGGFWADSKGVHPRAG